MYITLFFIALLCKRVVNHEEGVHVLSTFVNFLIQKQPHVQLHHWCTSTGVWHHQTHSQMEHISNFLGVIINDHWPKRLWTQLVNLQQVRVFFTNCTNQKSPKYLDPVIKNFCTRYPWSWFNSTSVNNGH